MPDWREITSEKEKYAAYLCSREWSEKKQAVHDRAGNKCERCRLFPIGAVHHLTYARKYDEPLEDLQAICEFCHNFIHAESEYDPLRYPAFDYEFQARFLTTLGTNINFADAVARLLRP